MRSSDLKKNRNTYNVIRFYKIQISTHRLSCIRDRRLLGIIRNVTATIINRTLDLLPIELKVPGYQYCGTGTNLNKILASVCPRVNKLDTACKEHDIAYYRFSDIKSISIADMRLAAKAFVKGKASDFSLNKKAIAWAVSNKIKIKAK